MQLVSFFAVDHRTGATLPGASVTVYATGTTTKAFLFNASEMSTPGNVGAV